jgi:hypothetical protein
MGQSRRDQHWPKPAIVCHVWVQSPEDHQPPDPGLVIEWRRFDYQWFAYVIVVHSREGSTAVIQRWFHQDDVIRAPTEPLSPDRWRWHKGWKNEQVDR